MMRRAAVNLVAVVVTVASAGPSPEARAASKPAHAQKKAAASASGLVNNGFLTRAGLIAVAQYDVKEEAKDAFSKKRTSAFDGADFMFAETVGEAGSIDDPVELLSRSCAVAVRVTGVHFFDRRDKQELVAWDVTDKVSGKPAK